MSTRQATPTTLPRPNRARLRACTRELRRQLAAFDYLASGSITTCTKVCGKPNCRCASDSKARDGPYHEWGRMIGKKLVHSNIPPERVEVMHRAIDNFRKAKDLLNQWEQLTAEEILTPEPDEPRPARQRSTIAEMTTRQTAERGPSCTSYPTTCWGWWLEGSTDAR